MHVCLVTYLLTSWCRVLLEKLTGLQLVKKFPAFHGTPKVHYRTHKRPPPVSILGQSNPVHIPTSHLLEIHPNIIYPSTPRSPQWSFSLRFPHQDPIHPLSSPIRATCPAHLILPDACLLLFVNIVLFREVATQQQQQQQQQVKFRKESVQSYARIFLFNIIPCPTSNPSKPPKQKSRATRLTEATDLDLTHVILFGDDYNSLLTF